MVNVQAKYDKISKVVGTAVCTGMLTAGWALLVASSAKEFKDTVDTSRQVPSLYEALKVARDNEIPSGYTPIPNQVVKAAIVQKLPSISQYEVCTLIITVEAEAGGETELGKMMVGGVVLGSVGTFKSTLYGAVTEKNRFSYLDQNKVGEVIRSTSQSALMAECAKPKYQPTIRALNKMIDFKNGTYKRYALDSLFYYNAKTSSPSGRAWMEQNTEEVVREGNHSFRRLKKKAKG